MKKFTSILSLVAVVASVLFVSCAKPKDIDPVKAFPTAKNATYAINSKGVHAWSYTSADTWSKGNKWTGFRIEPAPGDASRLWYYIEFNKSWTARIVSGQDYIQFRVGKDGYIGYDESQYYYTSTVSGERGMQCLVICPLQIPEVGEEPVVCELVCDMEGETMPLGTITINPYLE